MTSDNRWQPKESVLQRVFGPHSRRLHAASSALLSLALICSIGVVPADASSHREAPLITSRPKLDGTDFYMFRSYEPGRDGFVTLIADYIPLEDPNAGPNYYQFDSNGISLPSG